MPLTYEPCMPSDICLTGEGYLVFFIVGMVFLAIFGLIGSAIFEVKQCKEESKL